MTEYLQLKQSNCKNCYKCIRNCPVKSIRFSDNQANIISDECILCGRCFVVCPQNAKQIRNDIPAAKALIASGAPVYASIAPSFVANYGSVTLRSMNSALKHLGFAGAEETALGAELVKKQYDALVDAAQRRVIISSCCPTVNMLIQKHYPDALPYLAPVISPMQAHCRDLKRRYPGARTVFIGPCISKKAEAEDSGCVDCAITFEELTGWLKAEQIPLEYEAEPEGCRSRLFPTVGGILDSMATANSDYMYLSVDGIENCAHAIEELLDDKSGKCFIEMSACTGGCVGGPAMDVQQRHPLSGCIAVKRYAGKTDAGVNCPASTLTKSFEPMAPSRVHISDEAIADVLRQIGKTKPEDELNCGSCGYNTCREKAIAVLQGKANLTMCLPYLKEKAESFSDNIIEHTPNAIIVLDEGFIVQQLNSAACALINIHDARDVIGQPVAGLLDLRPFADAYENKRNVCDRQLYLADYGKYVEQMVIYDSDYHILICIMRDISEEVRQQQNKEALSRTTVEIADRMMEKQMRAVQEIASLLGETTAETRIALTRLKETLKDD